jgi:hypothetical protein
LDCVGPGMEVVEVGEDGIAVLRWCW